MSGTDAEIRAWARAQGESVTERGPIQRTLRDQYNAAHADPWPDKMHVSAADYPEGMSDADFDEAVAAEPPPEPEGAAEVRPRAIEVPKAKVKLPWQRAAPVPSAGAKAPRAKKKPPRVPVDDLIAGVWRGLAGMVRPLPATSRMLKIQAPIAGYILEDTVKGTAVDAFLQPMARAGARGEAVAVLVGPPVLVAAIEVNMFQRMKNPEVADVSPFALPVLRELMLRMCKVGGPKMAKALAQEREFEAEFGQTVDEMLAFMFAMPDDAAEDDGVRKMQEAMEGAAA